MIYHLLPKERTKVKCINSGYQFKVHLNIIFTNFKIYLKTCTIF